MAKYFNVDLILKQGSEYETPKRVGLVINKVGTNATTKGHLEIDEKPVGDIVDVVSPLHKTSSNLMGPLELGGLFLVVPPETKIIWEGPSGTKCRCIGRQVLLAPGEAMPADLMARFAAQAKHYMTYIEKTYSHGTDVKLVADAEVSVLEYTPRAVERLNCAYPFMASVSNYTPSEADLAVRFYYENVPQDRLLEKTKIAGFDILSCPRPPADTTEQVPASLAATPIVVEPERTLKAVVRNIKGADISPATGTSLTFTITMLVEYAKLE